MGRNFYHEITKPNGEKESRHIGKKSAGWQFMFRAYTNIESWQDWKCALLKEGKIFAGDDEYCIPDFIKLVRGSKPEKNHCEHCGYVDHQVYNDPEGWAFSLTEFC